MSAFRAPPAKRANRRAWPATARAPRSSRATAVMPPAVAVSARTTTSGSRTLSSASKSPARDAARNASITWRWRSGEAGRDVAAPRTRRRARLASWRVAVGVRSTIGATCAWRVFSSSSTGTTSGWMRDGVVVRWSARSLAIRRGGGSRRGNRSRRAVGRRGSRPQPASGRGHSGSDVRRSRNA